MKNSSSAAVMWGSHERANLLGTNGKKQHQDDWKNMVHVGVRSTGETSADRRRGVVKASVAAEVVRAMKKQSNVQIMKRSSTVKNLKLSKKKPCTGVMGKSGSTGLL